MTEVEREIIGYLGQLDAEKQRRVLAFIRELARYRDDAGLGMVDWLTRAESFRTELLARHGQGAQVGSLSLLGETREERSDDILGCR